MSDSGHPRRFGFIMCLRCRCWRRPDGLRVVVDREVARDDGVSRVEHHECADTALCSRLAGVGLGTLDADTGNVTP